MGSSASLDRSPRKNWVEKSGNLPPYVREIARSIEKSGKTLESAISIAISRIKIWAAGKGVTAKTQAKAAKALAQWEALKAKNATRRVAASELSGDDIAFLELAAARVEFSAAEDALLRLSMEREDAVAPGESSLERIVALGASSPTKEKGSGDGSGKHDLVWFEHRSTPKVLLRGQQLGDYPDSYGKVTSRNPASAEDEKKIANGEWVRKDQSGNKPSDKSYKKTQVRPGLVKASASDMPFW